MSIRSDARHRTAFAIRLSGLTLVALVATGIAAQRALGSDDAGVTDLTRANPDAIRAGDIAQALAVTRGTRIEAAAPPTLRLPVNFEFNSTALQPDATRLLDQVGIALSSDDLSDFRFSVEGHTDSVGSDGYNQRLSRARAAAVKTYLIEQGVPRERLGVVGHGESQPVATNDTEEGRHRNRRVELINLGSGDTGAGSAATQQ